MKTIIHYRKIDKDTCAELLELIKQYMIIEMQSQTHPHPTCNEVGLVRGGNRYVVGGLFLLKIQMKIRAHLVINCNLQLLRFL